ncbi:polysaccharide pyruvyl transferase family protein [Sphingomonas sp. ASY06-1R]|uniref:polysaccharide pyruvyl transferase family protein n=1 Tax=Sphingomonas sp. ASY06-1R TaxID=3445771 RepID=UPI003FA308FD
MKIGLIGTYDVENFGDCAFPSMYQFLLHKYWPDAQITLYSPTTKVADILEFEQLKELPGSDVAGSFVEDALVLTGGETISYGHSAGTYIYPVASYSAFLRLWLGPLLAAARGETRFIAHAVGGKLGDETPYKVIGRLLRSADLVTFRDQVSSDRMSTPDWRFPLATDPMFAIRNLASKPEFANRVSRLLSAENIAGGYIACQVSLPYVKGKLETWAVSVSEIAISLKLHVALVPICHFLNDAEVLESVRVQIANLLSPYELCVEIVPERVKIRDTIALIGCSSGFIGTSLHGAVTAVSFGKPLAVLSSSLNGKHEQTLRSVGVNGAVTDNIGGLRACFERTSSSDMGELADNAASLAERDFIQVVERLKASRQPRPEIDKNDVVKIVNFDKATVASFKHQLNRNFLLMLRRIPGLYEGYRSLRARLAG